MKKPDAHPEKAGLTEGERIAPAQPASERLAVSELASERLAASELASERLARTRLEAARAQWRWRGEDRPPFADAPAPGQFSVWDFPRPPALVREAREIVVRWGARDVARTCNAWAVRETAHPPTFYIPLANVQRTLLQSAGGGSFCEWKGPARYWHLADGADTLPMVAWSYLAPLAGAEPLADCIAFYAHHLDCTVGGLVVTPQAGDFYGGWITADLAGPFKGEPGSSGW